MFAAMVDELSASTDAELDDLLAEAELARRATEVRVAAIAAVIAHRGSFADHGHRSMKGFLKQRLNCSGVEANRIRRCANLFDQHPDVGDALMEGRIGVGQASRLAKANSHPRVGERFDEFAPILLDSAERLEFDDFDTAVEHFEVQADQDGAFKDQQFHEDERAASVTVVDGAVEVSASGGSPMAASEMKRIFQRAVDAEFHADCEMRRIEFGDNAVEQPLPRSLQQRRFDALHGIFMASVTAPAEGKRPEPLVNIVIDSNTAIEALAQHGFLDVEVDELTPVDPTTRRCAISDGTPLHRDVAVKAMLHGSVRRVIVDAQDVVVNLGRSQRLFVGKAREAAQLMAVTCGHRGCDVPADFCDVDHVDEWAANGGNTDQVNAMPLCGSHDRWKHRQRLRGRRDVRGRIHLIKPDGTVIKPVGARDPDWAEPDPIPDHLWEEISWAEYLSLQSKEQQRTSPDADVRDLDTRPI